MRPYELIHAKRDGKALRPEEIGWTAQHPRLEMALRLIDWAQFVAEHDDHHLAHARWVLSSLREVGPGVPSRVRAAADPRR